MSFGAWQQNHVISHCDFKDLQGHIISPPKTTISIKHHPSEPCKNKLPKARPTTTKRNFMKFHWKELFKVVRHKSKPISIHCLGLFRQSDVYYSRLCTTQQTRGMTILSNTQMSSAGCSLQAQWLTSKLLLGFSLERKPAPPASQVGCLMLCFACLLKALQNLPKATRNIQPSNQHLQKTNWPSQKPDQTPPKAKPKTFKTKQTTSTTSNIAAKTLKTKPNTSKSQAKNLQNQTTKNIENIKHSTKNLQNQTKNLQDQTKKTSKSPPKTFKTKPKTSKNQKPSRPDQKNFKNIKKSTKNLQNQTKDLQKPNQKPSNIKKTKTRELLMPSAFRLRPSGLAPQQLLSLRCELSIKGRHLWAKLLHLEFKQKNLRKIKWTH